MLGKHFAHLNPHAFTAHREKTRRYFLHHDMPYPVDCAVLGHKPVWIALKYGRNDGYVECARCTLRPILTDRALQFTRPDRRTEARAFIERAISEGEVYWRPRRGETHLEIAKGWTKQFAAEVSIGNAGSETPLDAHLVIPYFRGFYFGTNVLGARIAHWRSRRADRRPGGNRYTTLAWGVRIDGDHISWKVGADVDGGGPRGWRRGYWSWRDFLLGKVHVEHEKLGKHDALIPMPEGLYPARVILERWTRTRRTWRQSRVEYAASFWIEGGVPNGREKYGDWDSTIGFSVRVDDPLSGGWIARAELQAAQRLLKEREGYAGRPDWEIPESARNSRVIPHKAVQA